MKNSTNQFVWHVLKKEKKKKEKKKEQKVIIMQSKSVINESGDEIHESVLMNLWETETMTRDKRRRNSENFQYKSIRSVRVDVED